MMHAFQLEQSKELRGQSPAAATLLTASMLVAGVMVLASTLDSVTSIAYLVLALISMVIYYRYVTRIAVVQSLLFPVYTVLLIQVTVYPLYIFLTDNGRAFLFAENTPVYTSAIVLWGLALLGLGGGIAMRLRGVDATSVQPTSTGFLLDPRLKRNRTLFFVTLPLMICSSIASYAKFRAYGYVSIAEISDIGSFSADAIRRNRGLGPLTLVEMWSYVAVAYVGWHAFLERRLGNRAWQLALGTVYALAGSTLAILNARRGVVLIHLALLALPFLLKTFTKRRIVLFLLPLLLSGMFVVDRATSELRRHYYETNELDVAVAIQGLSDTNNAPLSFNHFEFSAALLTRLESGGFRPLWGSTFVAAGINWVPRSIFPEKPWTGGPYLSRAFGGTYAFDDSQVSSSLTTGIVVETLMNIGFYGFAIIPPIMFGLGFALTGMSLSTFAAKRDVVWLAAFSTYCWVATASVADDMGGLINKVVVTTVGLVVLGLLVRVGSKASSALRFPASHPMRL